MNENEMIEKLKKLQGFVISECENIKEEVWERENSLCGIIDGMIDDLKEEVYKRLRESAKADEIKVIQQIVEEAV